MLSEALLRILHISDAHISRSLEASQKLHIERALTNALSHSAGREINLIVFSGDLTKSGSADEYARAQALLLEPAMRIFGLTPDRIILVPGNHEIDRSVAHPDPLDRTTAEALLGDPVQLEEAMVHLSPWQEFHRDFYGSHQPSQPGPLSFVYEHTIGGVSVGIAALNSPWASRGSEDERRLLLGKGQIEPALDAIAHHEIRLVAVHHPLDWLSSIDAAESRGRLARGGVILLTGHVHLPDGTKQLGAHGEILALGARCLHEPSGTSSGYSLIEIDPGAQTAEVKYWRWYEAREDYDPDLDIAPDGREVFSLPLAQRHRRVGDPQSAEVVRSIAEGAVELACEPGRRRIASIDDLLAPPRFLTDSRREVDTIDIVAGSAITVVGGHPQSGVSSALHLLLDRSYRSDFGRVPVYLEGRESAGLGTPRGEATISRAARRLGFRELRLPGRKLALACDDIDLLPEHKRARLADFIAQNPQHRYFLGCHGASAETISRQLEKLGLAVQNLTLSTCVPVQLEGLAKTVPGAEDVDLDRIASAIRTFDLPRVPALLRILIAAAVELDDEPSDGTLLAAAVARLLPRSWPGDDNRRNRRQLRHLLATLARDLYEAPEQTLHIRKAERFFLDYTEGRCLPHPRRSILDELVTRHILKIDERGVSFTDPALLHLFVATWAVEGTEHIGRMLEDCHRHREVIRHASHLRCADMAILKQVADHTTAEIERLMPSAPGAVDSSLETIKPVGRRTIERLDAIHSLLSPRTAMSRLDVESDRLAAVFNCESGRSETPQEEPANRLAEAVALLSDVLANAELVDDVTLKQHCLEIALTGWVALCGLMIDADGRHPQLFRTAIIEEIDTRLGERALGADSEEMLIAAISVTVCCLVIRDHLAKPELGEILEAALDTGKATRSSTVAFLATWLHAELAASGWPRRIRQLAERLESNSLLWDALLAKAFKQCRTTTGRDVRHLENTLIDEIVPRKGTGVAAMWNEEKRQEFRQELIHARHIALSPREF